MVEFTTTKVESKLIRRIVVRAKEEGLLAPQKDAVLNVTMDLEACHSNGCPLDFQKLLDFPAPDFGHDVLGISRFIDRETGKLGGCFSPRCSLPEKH